MRNQTLENRWEFIRYATKIVHKWNGHLEIFSLPQAMENVKADLDGSIFAYNYRAGLTYVMTFDHQHAHDFHLRHPKISLAMLRKWPTSGSCRPWLTAFYVKKEGRDEGKG